MQRLYLHKKIEKEKQNKTKLKILPENLLGQFVQLS